MITEKYTLYIVIYPLANNILNFFGSSFQRVAQPASEICPKESPVNMKVMAAANAAKPFSNSTKNIVNGKARFLQLLEFKAN